MSKVLNFRNLFFPAIVWMWVHSIVLIEILFWLDVILVCNWSMFLDNGEVLVARLLFSYFIFFVLFFWPYLHFIMKTKSCSSNQFRAKLLKSWITNKFQLFSLILIDCTGGYSSVFQKDLVLRKSPVLFAPPTALKLFDVLLCDCFMKSFATLFYTTKTLSPRVTRQFPTQLDQSLNTLLTQLLIHQKQ